MASTYIQRNNGTPDNRKKFTFSFWVKRAKLGTYQYIQGFQDNGVGDPRITLTFRDNDVFELSEGNSSGTTLGRLRTSRKFRDTSAWYAITVAVDTTLATADDRIKIWVNGVQETAFDNRVNYTQNLDTCIDDNRHTIGAIYNNSLSGYFDGSLSHYHYCDGYAYQASNFGSTDSTTGEWQINTSPSVSYGTNGCFVLKDGNSVTDQSPNTNNFTAGGTLTKTEDSPSNVFATMNPLYLSSGSMNLVNGNLTNNGNSGSAWRSLFSTLGASSGKYYFEMKVDRINSGDTNNIILGIVSEDQTVQTADNGKFFGTSRGYGYHAKDGKKLNNDNTTANGVAYGSSWTTNDIIGCAINLDNHKIYWSKNGTFQASGVPTSGSTGTGSAFNLTTGYTYLVTVASYYDDERYSFNFGNGYFGTTAVSSAGTNASGIGIFEYDVPANFTALSTKGLNL